MNEKTAELMKAFPTDEFEREFWNGYFVYYPCGAGFRNGTGVMILENGDDARFSTIRECAEYLKEKGRTAKAFSDLGA